MAQIPFSRIRFISKKNSSLFTGTALEAFTFYTIVKNNYNYFFISICIAGIPLSILLLIQRYNCRVLKQTVSAYEAEQNSYVDTTVYLLSKALPAGEALTKDDLTSCTVKLPRSQSILYASDSKNLIGQYAKTALKKDSFSQPIFSIRMKDLQNVTAISNYQISAYRNPFTPII